MSHYFDQILNQVPYYYRMREEARRAAAEAAAAEAARSGGTSTATAGVENTGMAPAGGMGSTPLTGGMGNAPLTGTMGTGTLSGATAPTVLPDGAPFAATAAFQPTDLQASTLSTADRGLPGTDVGLLTTALRGASPVGAHPAIEKATGDATLQQTAQGVLYPYPTAAGETAARMLTPGTDTGLQKSINTPKVEVHPWQPVTPTTWQNNLAAEQAAGTMTGTPGLMSDPTVRHVRDVLNRGNMAELYSPDTVAEVMEAIEYDRSAEDDPFSMMFKSYFDGIIGAGLAGTISELGDQPLFTAWDALTLGDYDAYKEPFERYKKRHPLAVNPRVYNRPPAPFDDSVRVQDSTLERSFRDLNEAQRAFLVDQIIKNTPGKFSDALNSYLLGVTSNDPALRPVTAPALDKEPVWYESMLNTGQLPTPPRTMQEYRQAIELMDLKEEYADKLQDEIDRQNNQSLFMRLPVRQLRQALNTPDYHPSVDINAADIGNRTWTPAEQEEINRAFVERDRARFRDTVRQILLNNGYNPARLDEIPDGALRHAFESYHRNRNDYINEVLKPTVSYIEKLRREFMGNKQY